MDERRRSGFKQRTRLAVALGALDESVAPVKRTETMPASGAVGRVLADPVTARRPVPHYDSVAVDGYAVVAEDTLDASERSPAVLDVATAAGRGRAVPVDSGEQVPSGADAVLGVEEATYRETPIPTGRSGADPGGSTAGADPAGTVEVTTAVPSGENVTETGEAVSEGETVYESGRRLRQTDPSHLKGVGVGTVAVCQRPAVGVIPTGDELVDADPDPGQVVETDGLAVAGLVGRWGGAPTYRDAVADDRQSLRVALTRDLTRDVVVTTGGTASGERDLVPDVVSDLGEIEAHGLAIEPGHSAGVAVVRDVPVVMLPGSPAGCVVAATKLLRPAVKRAGRLPLDPHPSTEARLDRKIASEPGVRTVSRVRLAERDGETVANPSGTAGRGGSATATAADGWVVVSESREGIPAGEPVSIQHWEYEP